MTVVDRSVRRFIVLLAVFGAFTLWGADRAHAGYEWYCNGANVGPYGECNGWPGTITYNNAQFNDSNSHVICVTLKSYPGFSQLYPWACNTYYSIQSYGSGVYGSPFLLNNSGTTRNVTGAANYL